MDLPSKIHCPFPADTRIFLPNTFVLDLSIALRSPKDGSKSRILESDFPSADAYSRRKWHNFRFRKRDSSLECGARLFELFQLSVSCTPRVESMCLASVGLAIEADEFASWSAEADIFSFRERGTRERNRRQPRERERERERGREVFSHRSTWPRVRRSPRQRVADDIRESHLRRCFLPSRKGYSVTSTSITAEFNGKVFGLATSLGIKAKRSEKSLPVRPTWSALAAAKSHQGTLYIYAKIAKKETGPSSHYFPLLSCYRRQ